MNMLKQALSLSLMTGILAMPVHAWQVDVQVGADKQTQQISVSNNHQLHDVDAYLVWVDKDAQADQMQFMSWVDQQSAQWVEGIVPAFNEPIDIESFESVTIAELEQACPEEHRCFIALVAVNAGADPLDAENWQAVSLYPLTLAATKERLPGQRNFMVNASSNVNKSATPETTAAEDMAAAPSTDSDGTTPVEKPDIFSLVGNELLYANGQAERFQVVDLSDVKQPRLAAWAKMTGSPREIYVMDNNYVLLQTKYDSSNNQGTYLTVLTKDGQGKLSVVQELSLNGWFMESRRRGQMIYAVTQDYGTPMPVDCDDCEQQDDATQQIGVVITALQMGEDGQLTQVDQTTVPGYSPIVAIFNDHLVIANHNPQNWQNAQIQVLDLTSENGKLITLPIISVEGGYIPSEFHLSVVNQQLRFVYGVDDLKAGSSLAIYDLSGQKPSLLGKIDNIAPGEALFATRFVDNRAFVVTYERKDPLWVIDLTDPTKPSIMGELHVPGWSEKLFFNEDRLFAVGVDDQPLENEENQWVSRVALSLFDVKDPTNPTLLSKLVPFAGKASYSWSPATTDERALLLDWDDEFAALPINAWEMSAYNQLQIATFANDTLTDAGYLESPVSLQRSVTIGDHQLAALSDEALFTLQWGDGQVQQLGQVELASNLQWLKLINGDLWAGIYGTNGYYRLARYSTQDIENPVTEWKLPQSYNNLLLDDNTALFYNYYPLTIRLLDTQTGTVQPEHVLESQEDSNYSELTEPFIHDGWLYRAKNRWVQIYTLGGQEFAPADNYTQSEWVLDSWNLQTEKPQMAATRSIPGKAIGFSSNGSLITSEPTEEGMLRFNLLALEDSDAVLMQTRDLPCEYYSSNAILTNDAIYLNCGQGYDYYPMPVVYEEGNMTTTSSDEVIVDDQQPPEEIKTTLWKLNPEHSFAQEGEWMLAGSWNIQQVVAPDLLLVNPRYWYYWGRPMLDKMATDAMMMPYSSGCQLYRLTSDTSMELLREIETCYNPTGSVITADKIWEARGFAGIVEVK